MYNAYDINQQKTDDLRVLKSTAMLTPVPSTLYAGSFLGNVYETYLPSDYLHMLNCIVEYDVLKPYKCYNTGSKWQQGARRLTADMSAQIINNYYLRPTYKNPYFYINNINTENDYPTKDNQVDVIVNKYNIAVTSANVTTDTKITIILHGGSPITITASTSDTAAFLAADIISATGLTSSDVVVSGNNIEILDSAIAEISVSGPGVLLSRKISRVAEKTIIFFFKTDRKHTNINMLQKKRR
jgi:hypothetical protein